MVAHRSIARQSHLRACKLARLIMRCSNTINEKSDTQLFAWSFHWRAETVEERQLSGKTSSGKARASCESGVRINSIDLIGDQTSCTPLRCVDKTPALDRCVRICRRCDLHKDLLASYNNRQVSRRRRRKGDMTEREFACKWKPTVWLMRRPREIRGEATSCCWTQKDRQSELREIKAPNLRCGGA